MTMKIPASPNMLFATYKALDLGWSEVKWSEVAQLCPTLCDPMDCSLPGSSVHGIFQARVPEWVAFAFSNLLFMLTYKSLLSL